VAAAAAAQTQQRLTEAEVQRRVYQKELKKLRREFLEQRSANEAKEKQQKKQDADSTEIHKQQHLAEKHKRSLEKQVEAEKRQQVLMEQKSQERKGREQNRLLWEQKLSSDRIRLVTFLKESSKTWITAENIDRRLNDAFFENAVPWKFEFIPFCAPESPYWRENVNPLYVERQVSLKRLQDMMESTRKEVQSALTEEDLSRLQSSGLLLDLEDNVKWVAKHQQNTQNVFNNSVTSFKNNTIVNDDEDFPLDEYGNLFDEADDEDFFDE